MQPRPRVTQRQRIERLLMDRGPIGVHSFEMFQAGWPRAAAVVHRLRAAGWLIEARQERRGAAKGVRYILRSHPAQRASGTSQTGAETQVRLVEVPAAHSDHYTDAGT
jgi:hypothetical protein